MDIKDVMQSPAITVGPRWTLSEAMALMAEHGVSALPVIDDSQDLVGIVGEADLYRARLADQEAPDGAGHSGSPYSTQIVSDVMRRPVVSVRLSDSLRLCQLRLVGQARSLPVLDGCRVVGMVSRRDLLALFARADMAAGPQSVPVSSAAP